MRIGLDARFYHQKNAFGRYTRNLIDHLSQSATSHEYVCYVLSDRELPTLPRVRWRVVNIPWYSWQEQLIFPFIIRADRIDLMHYLHFNLSIFAPRPYVVTIHDFILHYFPSYRNWFSRLVYPLKYWSYRLILSRAIARSVRIIVVSDFTQSELQKLYPADSAKVCVIPPGITNPPERTPKTGSAGHVLYVGNCYPHKDIQTLLKAYIRYTHSNGEKKLHVVTPNDAYSRAYKKIYPHQSIVWLHDLSQEQLEQQFSAASVMVYASKYEGFGLPVLEALVRGLSVVCSDIPSLRQLAATLATYYQPDAVNDLYQILMEARWLSVEATTARSLYSAHYWPKLIGRYTEVYESGKI